MTYGDLVLMVPFLQRLKVEHPSANITVITGSRGRSLLRLYPWVDDVVDLSGFKQWRRLWPTLGQLLLRFRSDFVYALHPIFKAALLAFVLAGKQRIGFHQAAPGLYGANGKFEPRPSVTGWQQQLIAALLLTESREMNLDDDHASTRFLQLLRHGSHKEKGLRGSLRERFTSPDDARRALTIILAPFSGWTARNWPLERWAELSFYLSIDYPEAQILVSTERRLRERTSKIFSGQPAVTIFCPGDNFELLFTSFSKASLVIANDSFPLHVASALDIPAIGLFGPNRKEWFGALSDRSVNVSEPICCSPCVQSTGDEKCLQGFHTCAALSAISVEAVRAHCRTILSEMKT
jgi:ADP-heptose:LPS heptosyltransferase